MAGDPLLMLDRRIDAERDLDRIIDAIGTLDQADRDLLVLVAWEGLTSQQVGEVLRLPASTVRARMQRVRRRLRSVRQGVET